MNRLANILLNSQDAPETPARPQLVQVRFGHVVSVTGVQAIAAMEGSAFEAQGDAGSRIDMGALVKIPTPFSSVIGIVSGMSTPMPAGVEEVAQELRLIEISLAGEILTDSRTGKTKFRRGVVHFPTIGDAVMRVSGEELTCVYYAPETTTIEVGALF